MHRFCLMIWLLKELGLFCLIFWKTQPLEICYFLCPGDLKKVQPVSCEAFYTYVKVRGTSNNLKHWSYLTRIFSNASFIRSTS